MTAFRSRVIGHGMFVPSKKYSNNDISERMNTSDEWIQQRTGIKSRYWGDENTTSSGLGLEAAKIALEVAGLSASELDMIILATLSPDHEFPGTACFLQEKLGVSGIPALDVRQQCTGFIYALSIADQFIRTGTYSRVLVVGAEVHSKGLDHSPRGRDVSVLFGDGAGAFVLDGVEVEDTKKARHIWSTHLHADGAYAKDLWIAAPGCATGAERIGRNIVEDASGFPKMNGKSVFAHAVRRMPEVLSEALKANDISLEEVDLFIFHQANLRIIELVTKQLGIPSDKVFNTIQKYANTTAATIPIGFDEAVRAGVLKPGMVVASAAFGSGFTWASMILRW